MHPKSNQAQPFPCPLCDQMIRTPQAYPQHLRWHHPGMKHCPQCRKVMPVDQLAQHLAEHAAEPVCCPHCGKTMDRKSLGGHISGAHSFNPMLLPEVHAAAMQKRSANQHYRQQLSDRMKARNPMRDGNVREKMTITIREKIAAGELKPYGGRPYGNGAQATPAEQAAAELYPSASPQHVVPLGDGDTPYHYKIDIAWPSLKIGVDLDGSSHSRADRKAADRRKFERLACAGWTLLRMSNRDVLSGKLPSLLSSYGIMPESYTTSR